MDKQVNKNESSSKSTMWFLALLLTAVVAGCSGGGGGGGGGAPAAGGGGATVLPGAAGTPGANATDPTVGSASPSDGATNVATSTHGPAPANTVTGKLLTATFTVAMDPATIVSPLVPETFTLKNVTLDGIDVPGTVTMNGANTIATFTPGVVLDPSTNYTATVSTAAQSALLPAPNTAMAKSVAWSFTTAALGGPASLNSQQPVPLGGASTYSILTATGVTDVPASIITGDIGTTGGGTTMLVSCGEMTVPGKIHNIDAGYTDHGGGVACEVPGDAVIVNAAFGDMMIAYADAAGRTLPDATELGAGDISGLTITPGLYKWSTQVLINADVFLSGGPDDVWIFQIAKDLTIAAGADVASGIKVQLIGGAKAANVFWQVGAAGVPGAGATLNTFSTFNGTILSEKQVVLRTGAVLNGRAFAQTQTVLDQNPITLPTP